MKSKGNFIIYTLAATSIIALLMFSACSSTTRTPDTNEIAETEKSDGTEASLPDDEPVPKQTTVAHDKLGDTFYAGRITEINDEDFTIILGEEESVTYRMSDKARLDIQSLGIDVDTRVIVTFQKNGDGTFTALSVDKITVE